MKTVFLSICTMLFVMVFANAQLLPNKLFGGHRAAADITPLRNETIVFLTPNLPVNFSKLEKDPTEKWQIGSNMSIGASYSLVVGNGLENSNGSVQVEPYLNIGIFFNAGVTENIDPTQGGVVGTFTFGGTIGLYRYVNLAYAYDFVSEKPIIGLGTKIEIVTLIKGAGTVILSERWRN